MFETLYRSGDPVSAPDRYIETQTVAPGMTTVAELDTPVPGTIKLVDHALSRAFQKGTVAEIEVVGEQKHHQLRSGSVTGGSEHSKRSMAAVFPAVDT